LEYLFYHNKATICNLVDNTGINEKTIQLYIDQFVAIEFLGRISTKYVIKMPIMYLKKINYRLRNILF